MTLLTYDTSSRRFDAKLNKLEQILSDCRKVVVAFSGGVDSSFLAVSARKVLGREGAVCVTAKSPSLASRELKACKALVDSLDLAWNLVETYEMDNESYVRNNQDRCYFCKQSLMESLHPVARKLEATIVLGVNTDDLGDIRPGQRAAREAGAIFPLADSGLSKAEIRDISKAWGLPNWDKPAQPCLASRIPYGTPVNIARLAQVEEAEDYLHDLGFSQVRVRNYGKLARIELAPGELSRCLEFREEITTRLKRTGFQYVTIDLEGFRSGNLNATIGGPTIGS